MEDVKNLTKEEFLKFLNCSHHSVNIKPEKIVVTGPGNRKINVLKQFGKYSASDVQLEECALNHQVLRVPLPKVDIENLSLKQVALRFKTKGRKQKKRNVGLSRFGRKLKKKQINVKVQSLIRSRVITRSTKFLDKNKVNKPSSIPVSNHHHKTYQKIKKPNIIAKPQITAKSKVTLKQQMDSLNTIFKAEGPQKSPIKPQFIIKYVPAEPTYFLKMSQIKHPEDGKLQYPFDVLVKDIKNMKLPSPTWKIKVVVKNNKISSIIFTNKCVLERTVSFNAKSSYYQVVIENKPALLLGSPNDLTCVEDIEILLNIIHTISAKNPMICYKN